MNKRLKTHGKDALSLAGLGIGLTAATSVASGMGAPTGAISKMSSALPTVGGLYSMKMVIDTIDNIKKKNGKRF